MAPLPFDSRWAFAALFALLALERLAELVLARRNLAWALARGGRLVPEPVVWPAMVAMHALFLLLPPLEAALLDRPLRPAVGLPALVVAAAAMALRYWAIGALGRRWNPRVVVLPGEPPVAAGPYRYLCHPNYLAVGAEIAALPLVHGAWLSALLFSAANAAVLRARIRTEERAFAAAAEGQA